MGRNDKFILDIKNEVTGTIDEIFSFKKKVAIDLFSRVINDTPADEGTLRANWYVTQSSPSSRYTPNAKDNVAGTGPGISKDAGGKAHDRMVERINSMDKPSGAIYMTNNSPYGDMIEYGLYPKKNSSSAKSKITARGFSKKAPAGMVDKNVIAVKAGLK